MAKKVHPAPEQTSVNGAFGSITSDSSHPMVSSSPGPQHPSIPQYKPSFQNSGSSSSNNNNYAGVPVWTEAAKLAATSCCAVGGGCGAFVDGDSDNRDQGAPTHASPWMDYLWLCEGDGKGRKHKRRSRKTRLFLQQQLQPSGSKREDWENQLEIQSKRTDPKLLETDYAKLHEEFFESLLMEQERSRAAISGGIPPSTSDNKEGLLRKSESRDTCSSVSSGVSANSSKTMETTAGTSAMSASLPSTTSVQTLRKKHRPLMLHKVGTKGAPHGNRKRPQRSASESYKPNSRLSPIEAYGQLNNPASVSSESISLDAIMAKTTLKSPAEYVHAKCILQKDKGKGERLKSCISARGRNACLAKLRDKIRLVLQMSSAAGFGGAAGCEEQVQRKSHANSGMKRRLAKVSDFGPSFVETRSMLELQLGFLSMQYGLLIHWDTAQTGKIIFICLRKMCNDAFYSKIPDLMQEPAVLLKQQQQLYPSNCLNRQQSRVSPTAKLEPGPPLVIRCQKGNHAIYQRLSGSTEVVLVDGPYRVPQPEVFAPSVLSVDIHEVTGLDHRKSQWTLNVTFDGHTEIADLEYNPQTKAFVTRRATPCQWEMVLPREMTSFDMAGLEIRLFEQRTNRRGVGRNVLGGRDSRLHGDTLPSRYAWRNVGRNSLQNNKMTPKANPPKKSTSRLASTMTMPLGGLVSQPSTSQTTVWTLTIPFTHDESAQLTLTLAHQSEYANWLYQELRARRKEELATSSISSWQPSLLKRFVSPSYDGSLVGEDDFDVMDYHFDLEEDEADGVYLSDWFCGICYLFPLSSSN